jgi:hypothetical protein
MRYRFDQFELDTKQFSLRPRGSDIHIEPLVLGDIFAEENGWRRP